MKESMPAARRGARRIALRAAGFLLAGCVSLAGCGGQAPSPKAGALSAERRTPNEILGYGADEVLVVIHADDLGMSRETTDASVAALIDGTVSSASLWLNGDDADYALALLKERPDLDVGLHLSLTGGKTALVPRDAAPSLYGDSGAMWATMDEVNAHVTVEDATAEWEAQIAKALGAGIDLQHLDGHMGCYFGRAELFKAAFYLAKKYRIPLIAPCVPAWVGAKDRNLFMVSEYTGIYTLSSGEETLENRRRAYDAMYRSFTPGVHYIYTHLARRSSDPAKMTGDIPLRADELEYWERYGNAALKEAGIRVIGTRGMKEAFLKELAR